MPELETYGFRFLCDVNRTLAMRERGEDGSDIFTLYDDAKEFFRRRDPFINRSK